MIDYDTEINRLHESVESISESGTEQKGFFNDLLVRKAMFIGVLYIIFVMLLVSIRPKFILTDNIINKKKMLLYSLLFTSIVTALWYFRHSIMSLVTSTLS
jgi:hypothetical protein